MRDTAVLNADGLDVGLRVELGVVEDAAGALGDWGFEEPKE